MAGTVFPHKDMAKLSYEFVAVVGHRDPDHGEHDYIVGREKTHLCAIYDLPSCKAHEDMATALSQKRLLEGVRATPTHIIYNPHDLEEISRANGMSVSQIESAIAEAQKALGKPVRWREYSKMRTTLDAAAKAVDEKDWRKALKELKGFDAGGMENLATEAEGLMARILDAGREKLAEAKAAIDAGEVKKARDLLRDLKRDFDRTEIEEQAAELLSSLRD